MKPPISYYGGKQKMASKIIPLIPKHTIYVEPFAGGCAILFGKPYPAITNNNTYTEVINDSDRRLINFFVQLRCNGKELVEKIRLTLYSEDEHRISKDMHTGNLLEDARRYYVNINQSFNNILNSGWRRSKKQNAPSLWQNRIRDIDGYIQRMQGIYICNTNALECIRQWDTPDTFFYIDPPYVNADQGHYKGYTEDDFKKLCVTLDSIQGSFLLSNYDSDIPNKKWKRHEFFLKTSASKTKDAKRVEVVWSKPSSYPPSSLASRLYASGKFDCYKEQLR